MQRIKAWGRLAIATAVLSTATIFLFGENSATASSQKHITPLVNRVVLENISGSDDSQRAYQIKVPAGASNLVFTAFGSDHGNPVNLYVRFDALPTVKSFDTRDIGATIAKSIAIRDPRAGTYYLLVHGANGRYADVSVVASYAPPDAIFKTGIHAHRLYNGGDGSRPADPLPTFQYGVIRDWDITHLQDAVVWKSDESIDFTTIDQVYAGHARNGAKVIKVFGSVPTWASKRSEEPNRQYPNWPGGKSGPRDLDEYEDYIFRFVSHTKDALWAVEGWNEPYACPGSTRTEFTTMTPTELADVQKRVYRATKRVDSHILVFSPAQAYVCGIPTILAARTSQGEPMSKFFDVLAWHPYNRSAKGNAGPAYASEVYTVRQHLANAGLSKMQIADTEHGWLTAPKEGGREFYALSDNGKGQVLYDTARLAKSLGVLTVVWYGYDNDMIGNPANSPEIADQLERAYKDLNTP